MIKKRFFFSLSLSTFSHNWHRHNTISHCRWKLDLVVDALVFFGTVRNKVALNWGHSRGKMIIKFTYAAVMRSIVAVSWIFQASYNAFMIHAWILTRTVHDMTKTTWWRISKSVFNGSSRGMSDGCPESILWTPEKKGYRKVHKKKFFQFGYALARLYAFMTINNFLCLLGIPFSGLLRNISHQMMQRQLLVMTMMSIKMILDIISRFG